MKTISLMAALLVCVSLSAQKVSAHKGESYGEGIQAKKYITTEALVDQLAKSDTVEATVHATVTEVCQVKGCWMTFAANDDTEMMVRFKDYGFFVPKGIGGQEIIVEGKAYSTVVPVDELRHYAEDAGKSKEEIEAITEPEKKFQFMATGVMVLED